RLVARRISLADGQLLLERGAMGWRLLGAQGNVDVNLYDTLYQSDKMDVALSIGFVGADGQTRARDEIELRYRAVNRGGQHRHRLALESAAETCTDSCRAEIAFDESEAIYFVRPRAVSVKMDIAGLVIPAPLVGADGLSLTRGDGYWWRLGEQSAGRAALDFGGLRLDGGDSLGGGFEVVAAGSENTHQLELRGTHLQAGNAHWQLPDFWMSYENETLQIWTERIDAGLGAEFFAGVLPEGTVAYRWLNGMSLEATALNVHGFLNLPTFDFGYSATVRDVALDGYKGAPWIRGGAGELLGSNRSVQLQINADDLGLQFPDMFHHRWELDHIQGRLIAWISRDYFGLRGLNLRGEIDGSLVSGGFALTRPVYRYDERLSLLLNVDHTTVSRGKEYIPYQLPAGLPEWLEDGPRAGRLDDVALAYHGQIHTRPLEIGRRVELVARITDGQIEYHPDWPEVLDLSGQIALAGRDVRIRVDEGLSADGTDLAGSRIRLGDNAAYVDIDLESVTTANQALEFIRSTPLAEWMSFVTPDWAGLGPLELSGNLHIPLKFSSDRLGERSVAEDDLEVDLDVTLEAVDLDLPSYGVMLRDLMGELRYRYPYDISGSGVRGRIFDRPAVFSAESDADTVVFRVDGQAPYEEVLTLLDIADPGVIRGGFDFVANLHIELGEEISRLEVVSDLTGMALELPGEFSKLPDDSIATELELRFLDDYQAVSFNYGAAQGWLHVSEVPLRGAIGFSSAPPLVDSAANELVLGGRINGFSLDEVVPDGEGGPAMVIPLRLDGLEVGLIDVSGIGFRDAVLNGELGGDGVTSELDLSIFSPDLEGIIRLHGDEALKLDLGLVRLPEGDGAQDPLDVQMIPELVDADIVVSQLFVGEEDYGAWEFQLRLREAGVVLKNLNAQLRGVAITADEVTWDAASNRSTFSGALVAGDLSEVLPLWGYAPSVATEAASMEGTLSWQGSPPAVELELLVGRASFEAENGRFLEATTGADAMRIFSLVNFSTITKRLNFDFSDVVGEGVSFYTLTAVSQFDVGMMHFIEPLSVAGSGSRFKIAGHVNLEEGTLDNEMIVTLPVTQSLPWYAAYIALANPLAGLGVLVGERVLRRPLEQFSSAKYQISGSFDEPDVKFVSVWDTRLDQPHVGLEHTEFEAPEGEVSDGEPLPPGSEEPDSVEASTNRGSTTG
ncbi:MAG: YhdP family protein, partial [Pseudomonadales bacterium]